MSEKFITQGQYLAERNYQLRQEIAAVTAERDALREEKRDLMRALYNDPQYLWRRDQLAATRELTKLREDKARQLAAVTTERDALRDENNAFKSHLGTSFTKLVMKKIKEKNK